MLTRLVGFQTLLKRTKGTRMAKHLDRPCVDMTPSETFDMGDVEFAQTQKSRRGGTF